eukprot:CAMPEP_0195534916 /NCGR_PEP_ID=MMETSP0794_2-20130614/43290_1 /TAXON_ID=515487 /ORGANISM="Stephanopyxis turris, Strain CCMP 815" /LENGTH=375 /DNA_ID=CAMNT_0040667911 /DNA_START=64 /DNA_END=1191 /DNA_ORIENTATION=+
MTEQDDRNQQPHDSNNREQQNVSHDDESQDTVEESSSCSALDSLIDAMTDELHIHDDEEEEEEEDDEGSPSLATIARWMKEGACSKVVILSGAGVSVSAGIPDFRTPGTGLYDNLQKYNLPFPEAVFDVSFYRRNPVPFLSLAKEIWPGMAHEPTLTHSFVRLLDEKGLLLRNYTQNIDGLEVLAGVTPKKVVECHGNFRSASCIECQSPYDGELCKTEFLTKDYPPRCSFCKKKGLIKPDIVFFGEGLPDLFFKHVRGDLSACDLLIVMGTSLMVQPVSNIPDMVGSHCPRLLLNRERVGNFQPKCESNHRDVFEPGDCDDSVLKLCRLAGWEDELLAYHASAKLDYDKNDNADGAIGQDHSTNVTRSTRCSQK